MLRLSHYEGIVNVVAGDRQDSDRNDHPPVEQPQRILPHVYGYRGTFR
jgi:hypothetical protein